MSRRWRECRVRQCGGLAPLDRGAVAPTNLKPHRQGTFKLSKDPAFAAKVADIVGLYLDPPGGAVVLSLDEENADPSLRPYPAVAADRLRRHRETHHDYLRYGNTNLFAALDVAAGQVIGECRPSRDGANFLAILKKPSSRTEASRYTWCWTTCPLLAKVRLVQTNIKQLVANNAK